MICGEIIDPSIKVIYPDTPDWTIGDLEEARRSMTCVNADLNPVSIDWHDETLSCSGRSFKVRVYRPVEEKGTLPCLVFTHGGGFYGGNLEAVHNTVKYLTRKANCVSVSIEYSLAPEHPYPQGFEDCCHALDWVFENADALRIDPDKVGVAGDSAGGNLSIALAVHEADTGKKRLKYMGLIYPGVVFEHGMGFHPDFSFYQLPDHPDRDYACGLIRMVEQISEEANEMYLSGGPGNPRYRSPLLIEQLPALPRATVAAAEMDALYPSVDAFAEKLRSSGTETRYILYKGVPHGFMDLLGDCPKTEDLLMEIAHDFRSAVN